LARYAALSAGVGDVSDPAGRRKVLLEVSEEIGGACVMTSATTAAGFLAFGTSGTESFVQLGVLAAFGVGVALVLTFTFLVILLSHVPPQALQRPRVSLAWERTMQLTVRISRNRPGPVLALAAALFVICAWGTTRLRVDVDIPDFVGEDSQVMEWMRFVQTELREPDTLEIGLRLPEGSSLQEPRVLARLDSSAAALEGIEDLRRPRSVLQPLGRVHQFVLGEEPDYSDHSDAATSAEGYAQLLLLLEIQDPDLMARWVSADGRFVRISVEADAEPHSNRKRILAEVRERLSGVLDDSWQVEVTGPLPVFRDMIEGITRTQNRSLATAGVFVFAMLLVFFRSPRAALLGMVPTLLPVVVVLGTLGLLGINLDLATALVGAIVVGIAVDDTIHLMNQYQRQRMRGQQPAASIHLAVLNVGRAMVTTSVALALGFLTMTLASWKGIANVGWLVAIAILVALVATLLLLPALIVVSSGHSRRADDVSR
jgi:predicted RND superfamily exporter protein